MLVLTRKIGERIMIGDDVVLTVIECTSGRVRLGFEAPVDIKIDREEIRSKRDEG
jgi:carbon storage regulator